MNATAVRVESASNPGTFHTVTEDSCDCQAFYFGSRRDANYVCRHQREAFSPFASHTQPAPKSNAQFERAYAQLTAPTRCACGVLSMYSPCPACQCETEATRRHKTRYGRKEVA